MIPLPHSVSGVFPPSSWPHCFGSRLFLGAAVGWWSLSLPRGCSLAPVAGTPGPRTFWFPLQVPLLPDGGPTHNIRSYVRVRIQGSTLKLAQPSRQQLRTCFYCCIDLALLVWSKGQLFHRGCLLRDINTTVLLSLLTAPLSLFTATLPEVCWVLLSWAVLFLTSFSWYFECSDTFLIWLLGVSQ